MTDLDVLGRRTRLGAGDAPAWALLIAGASGAAAAIFLAVVPPAVPEDQYSYPLSAGGFTAIQVFFFVHHLALAWGLYAVWQRGLAGRGLGARVGGPLAVVAMTLLGVHELVAISAGSATYPSDRTDLVDGIYGALSMLNGLALITFGLAAVAAARWSGWRRWVLLGLGIYVFVPMTPAIFGPFILARLAIGGWMLLFAALGWALLHPARHGEPGRLRSTRPGD